MRRAKLVVVILALAALACNLPGLAGTSASQPEQLLESGQPVEQTTSDGQPPSVEVPSPSDASVVELSPDQIERIVPASVQIIAAQGSGGFFQPLWTGSGTIISPEGEIITNCHVACGAPTLIIRLSTSPDRPPEDRYIAEVTHFDEDLDLAILRVVTDMDGNPVSPTDLPYLETGDSDSLRLGDRLFIFGYPGVGGETITFTTGSVSGFESATVAGEMQRVIIKTDASIAGGNSGGTAVDLSGRLVAIPTAVNPDVREGITIGGLGILRPVNLIEVVRQQPGAPPSQQAGSPGIPPSEDPDANEPNNDFAQATGPLSPGQTVTGYISWENDLDFFYITPRTTQPITISLTGIPPSTDYDLYLVDAENNIVALSDSVTPQEFIEYSPLAAGTYWIVVAPYSGASISTPYTLSVSYDGGGVAGGGDRSTGTGVRVFGQAVDGNTRTPLPGGVFGILRPGVTCNRFFSASELDLSLVLASAETDGSGYFELNGIPTGASYAAFFIYRSDYVCENDWLVLSGNATDTDLGVIQMTFN